MPHNQARVGINLTHLGILLSLVLALVETANPLCEKCTCECRLLSLEETIFDACEVECPNRGFETLPEELNQPIEQWLYVSLNLQANKVTSLKKDDVRIQMYVRLLSLSGNEIAEIEPGGLDFAAIGLQYLYLTQNRLTKITKGMFRNLTTLNTLRLNNNQITTVEPGAFSELESLEFLYIDDNNLKSIQSQTFMGLPKLNNLILSSNQIECIEEQGFKGLHNLIYLDLTDNLLETIDGDAMGVDLQKLSSLWLGYNKLKTIEVTLFENAPQIHILDVSENELEMIDECVFNFLPNNPWLHNFWTQSNPIVCDCDAAWMRYSYRLIRGLADVPMCSHPPEYSEYSILNFPDAFCQRKKCEKFIAKQPSGNQSCPTDVTVSTKRSRPKKTDIIIEYRVPLWAYIVMIALGVLCILILLIAILCCCVKKTETKPKK